MGYPLVKLYCTLIKCDYKTFIKFTKPRILSNSISHRSSSTQLPPFKLTLQKSTVQAWPFNKTEATVESRQQSEIKTKAFIAKFTINWGIFQNCCACFFRYLIENVSRYQEHVLWSCRNVSRFSFAFGFCNTSAEHG